MYVCMYVCMYVYTWDHNGKIDDLPSQWIGLRENLDRKPPIFDDFPMKYRFFL